MKIYRLAILVAFVLGVVAFGCKPDNVTPSDENVGAYLQNDTDHSDILPLCSSSLQSWPLVAWNYLNTGANVTLGSLKAGNDLERVGFLFQTSSFVFGEVALWYDQSVCGTAAGNKVCNIPKDASGNWIPTAYNRYSQLNPVTPDYSIFISMTDVEGVFTASAWAKAYFMVINPTTGELEPQITTPLWAVSKSTGGPGSLFDVALSMGGCPDACEPWIGATTNPCAGPVCSVPRGVGPGDDLSDYNCQGKSKKVTVCHVPPGNPANMHEICISVNALPAHILDFKPANNPCLGHHSGCHLGPCDPCGPGSTMDNLNNWNTNPNDCPGSGGNGKGKNK